MEGLEGLAVDQAFELTDASAERSAAGAVIALGEEQVARFLKSNIALMKRMVTEGYQDAGTLKRRIRACEKWLVKPTLLKRDPSPQYAAELEIDLSQIKEPILACPNDPDDVRLLSEVAGERIDEVFVGSCMTNIGHFRAVGQDPGGCGISCNPPLACASDQNGCRPVDERRLLLHLQFGGRPP